MAGGPVTHRGAAGDWYTVFGPTLDVSFNAGAESAVHRRPHVSFLQDGNTAGSEYNRRRHIQPSSILPASSLLSHPVDLVPDSAVLHLLHLHVGQTVFAALVALAAPWPRAPLVTHHCGILGRRRTPSGKQFIIMNRVLE